MMTKKTGMSRPTAATRCSQAVLPRGQDPLLEVRGENWGSSAAAAGMQSMA